VTLHEELDRLSGRVLVAMDFDGTLAEIVPVPGEAAAVPGALDALEVLAARPDTEVAVISGRSMGDLRAMAAAAGVVLVGEHGAVWEGVEAARPDGFDEILPLLERAASLHAGAWVEVKQASLVVHTRGLEPWREDEVLAETVSALEAVGHSNFHTGKHIVDVGFVAVSKGVVVERLRAELECPTIVFAGDDTTDETVFETLRASDIGIKVGEGPSAARYRVAGPADVVEVLRFVARRDSRPDGDTPPSG
jgi:trehalose 6-phosphate phosphatase